MAYQGYGTKQFTDEERAKGRFRLHQDGIARREKFLHNLAIGASVGDACKAVPVAMGTYFEWRQKFPEFRTRVDLLKAKLKNEKGQTGWDGDFASFRKTFLGYDTYWHQHQIAHALQNAGPLEVVMVLCPPEHGKTSLMADWICYKLATEPNHRIVVVSEAQGHARKLVGRIERRMTDMGTFGDFIIRFGPFRAHEEADNEGRPWTRDYFTVLRSDHDEQDYSLEAKGSTGQIAGTRVDTLIVDDIQSLRNVAKTQSLVELFRQDFLSRLGKVGRIFIVGTRVANDDFYDTLLGLDGVNGERVVSKCVTLPATDDDGEPLCPELWPAEALARKRVLVGEDAWWRNYQQRPQLAGNATFTEEMVEQAKDPTRSAGKRPDGSKQIVVGLDPALGGGNALVALAFDSTTIDILDCVVDYDLARTEQILDRLDEFCLWYKPNHVAIEINAFQRGLARDDRLNALARRYGFSVRPHTTNRNKADEVLGVAGMARSFLCNEVTIPWANEYSVARMEPLVIELRAWRPSVPTRLIRQDLVLAFWFAWKLAIEQRNFLTSSAEQWKRQGLPYRPMSYAALRSVS